MQTIVTFAPKGTSGGPLVVVAGGAVIFILMAVAYRLWRISGRVPVALVLLIACFAAAGCIVWLRTQRPAAPVTVYADRIVTADSVIPLAAITSIRIQDESSIGYVGGRPVPNVRRKLIAETSSGPKTIATDDLYDVDKLLATIEAKRSARR